MVSDTCCSAQASGDEEPFGELAVAQRGGLVEARMVSCYMLVAGGGMHVQPARMALHCDARLLSQGSAGGS